MFSVVIYVPHLQISLSADSMSATFVSVISSCM